MKRPFVRFLLIALLCTGLVSAVLFFLYGMDAFAACLIAVNATTLFFYGYDKLAAGRKMLRVPERMLHLLALAFGSPAALLGQQLFRHKRSKKRFLLVFWMIVALQSMLLGAFLFRKYGGGL